MPEHIKLEYDMVGAALDLNGNPMPVQIRRTF